MALEIKHVKDLQGLDFFIPSYQRGYRWEKRQIEQLLDDFLEFCNNIKAKKQLDKENQLWNRTYPNAPARKTDNCEKVGFYCLQPLAVTSNGGKWDLIDGQQRLTTVYLILTYLTGNPIYTIAYESRDDLFFKNKAFTQKGNNSISNIDFYFMTKAYETIDMWFQNHQNTKYDIQELLLPHDFNGIGSEYRLLDDQLHDVRFIWYETPAKSSIQTFNDLNYGKISLTDAELVKALFFQCDFSTNVEVAKNKASLRSIKWSLMEESLQDEFFWGMLTPSNYQLELHLELILRFVAEEINEENKYGNEKVANNLFDIFSKAISDNGFTADGKVISNIEDRIESLWGMICKVYTVFHNWYKNRALYHHIGLLIFLACNYQFKKDKNVHIRIIRELYQEYRQHDKSAFTEYLRKRIGEYVSIQSKHGNGKVKQLHEIMYEDNKEANEIRKILLLFNVEETIRNDYDEARFPFHLADQYVLNSLEHIHPQNLAVEDIEYEKLKVWFDERVSILTANGVMGNPAKTALQQAVNQLVSNLSSPATFANNKVKCLQDLKEVDKEFDELAGMRPSIMHSLYNMALVDKDTNAALQNGLLDSKREKLKERSESGVTYVPIGTWHVFNKYYSKQVSDLQFWTENDRKEYFEQIRIVYNYYTK